VLNAYNLKQCLFGEHLLSKDKESPVYVFEAEKTAVVASVFFNEAICVATGALQNINSDLLRPLRGRTVKFFPDKGAAARWEAKLKALGVTGLLYTGLEALPDTELKDGGDLADTLYICDAAGWALNEPAGYPKFWDFNFPDRSEKLA